MAQVTLTVPDVAVPRIRAAAVARGFDADGDGVAANADVVAYIFALLKRDVRRVAYTNGGESAGSQSDSELG